MFNQRSSWIGATAANSHEQWTCCGYLWFLTCPIFLQTLPLQDPKKSQRVSDGVVFHFGMLLLPFDDDTSWCKNSAERRGKKNIKKTTIEPAFPSGGLVPSCPLERYNLVGMQPGTYYYARVWPLGDGAASLRLQPSWCFDDLRKIGK